MLVDYFRAFLCLKLILSTFYGFAYAVFSLWPFRGLISLPCELAHNFLEPSGVYCVDSCKQRDSKVKFLLNVRYYPESSADRVLCPASPAQPSIASAVDTKENVLGFVTSPLLGSRVSSGKWLNVPCLHFPFGKMRIIWGLPTRQTKWDSHGKGLAECLIYM